MYKIHITVYPWLNIKKLSGTITKKDIILSRFCLILSKFFLIFINKDRLKAFKLIYSNYYQMIISIRYKLTTRTTKSNSNKLHRLKS